ncbi:hypothetical protein JS756_34345 [Streptomyces actuosus]|uniref:Uncharacterized protein n=1 Tax=Streptomyces actuosus TaxID=1885 RepID=A0ABS2W0Y0_STRAS|nr:hypothetical protein [Streptomyces actuosus]MBN0049075.1 hypothetical protein [Streptomyces actuosus]
MAAILALPLLILAGLAALAVLFLISDDALGGSSEKVPCADALAFGGARLPAGAYDADCRVESWLDTHYAGTFRMPRAEVRGRLTGLSPQGAEPGTAGCDHGVDLCLELGVENGGLPAGAEAHAVTANVTYEDATTARVRWSAFTT